MRVCFLEIPETEEKQSDYDWLPLKMCGARQITLSGNVETKIGSQTKKEISSVLLRVIGLRSRKLILNKTRLNTGLTCERILSAT